MNWLKRKLQDWVRDTGEDKNGAKVMDSRDVDSVCEAEPILNFRVFSAVGGRVVEFRQYDRQKDRSYTQTYIITSEQDFGERIAKIATIESLRS
jgi:hypothetical protein